MTSMTLDIDVVIIGGGVAGLWTLNLLRNRGYSAILFEANKLGSGQTIGSQGMIHGGIKYALGGAANASYESVSAMPAIWRDCLAGRGAVDLSHCLTLSDSAYLWSAGSAGSRLKGFLASKLLSGQVNALEPDDYPAPFRHPAFRGNVYRLPDPVLDVSSLVTTLADPHRDAIFSIDWQSSSLQRSDRKAIVELSVATVRPRCLVFTAGAGNEALVRSLRARGPGMQRRPLQQVLVKHEYHEPLFGHCIGSKTSPRLTVSTHRASDGLPVWYLGGDLATAGATEEPDRLVKRARQELKTLLPWIDLGSSQWRTIKLDRAEPSQALSRHPGASFVEGVEDLDNVIVAWPVKLTLAPRLGDQLLEMLRQRGVQPGNGPGTEALDGLPRPEQASPYWDNVFQ